MKSWVKNFWQDESGASLLEYSILVGLITAATIGLVSGVGSWVTGKWQSLSTTLTTAPPTSP